MTNEFKTRKIVRDLPRTVGGGDNTDFLKFEQDYGKLLAYTKDLNALLHGHKIKESQRSLLIGGILIALRNEAFRSAYRRHEDARRICEELARTIRNEFAAAGLPSDRTDDPDRAFSFLETNTSLTGDKGFVLRLIGDIEENVHRFIQSYRHFDTLGQFYIEFLRYANNDKGLGIVLTPPHITELLCELAEIDRDNVVYDNCCGTGGFLISAMKRMARGNPRLIGVEYQDDIYALAVSNAILHGEGKIALFRGNCFEKSEEIRAKFQPNVGLLNPPYRSQDVPNDEWEFVLNNLEALEIGAKCLAVIPMSCVIGTSGDTLTFKRRILREHTLEAVFSMPEELFHNSKVAVHTCVVFLTAHQPHPDAKETWLGYWRDDGFAKTKKRGRIDVERRWSVRKKEWISAFVDRKIVDRQSCSVKLSAEQEWCAEAYLRPDYENATEKRLMEKAKRYLAYRLLYDLTDLDLASVAGPKPNRKAGSVELSELFTISNGITSSQVQVKEVPESDADLRYLRPSQTYEGSVAGYVDRRLVEPRHVFPENTLYVSTDGQGSHTYSYVSSFEFVPNSNVAVLVPVETMSLQEKLYYAECITLNRFKFSYGRKPKGDRLKRLQVPRRPPDFVYSNLFERILGEWQSWIAPRPLDAGKRQ